MLVLTRKTGQRIFIGDDIVVSVVTVRGNQVRLGIEAPEAVPVRREEICFDPPHEPELCHSGKAGFAWTI